MGIGIGLVGPKYWYSCGAENKIGLAGLWGDRAPKSTLPRLLKFLCSCWVLADEAVLTEAMELFRVCLGSCVVVVVVDLITGKVMPLSLPRLATPTPQVSVVRYPEHSFPISTHCPQYGRRRSHFIPRFLHAKQSSVAPVAGALLLRFLGAAALLLAVSTFWTSMGWVVVETAMMESMIDVSDDG